MSKENAVGKEVAEQDFERMREAMGIVEVEEILDTDAKATYDANVARVVRAIQVGSLTVNDKGTPMYTDSKDTEHTFKEPLGGLYLTPQKKNSAEMAAIYQYAAELTSGSCSRCSTLPMRDIRVIVSLVGLFTAL